MSELDELMNAALSLGIVSCYLEIPSFNPLKGICERPVEASSWLKQRIGTFALSEAERQGISLYSYLIRSRILPKDALQKFKDRLNYAIAELSERNS